MIVLAIDTTSRACAAAVHDSGANRTLSSVTEEIGRGHAERLMDVIAQALREAGSDYSALGRVAACAGPGSFTGIRVGLASARGVALALSIPAVGICALEALRAEAVAMDADGAKFAVLAAVKAGRGDIYARLFAASTPASRAAPAFATQASQLRGLVAGERRLLLCGSAAREAAEALSGSCETRIVHEMDRAPIAMVARIGAAADPGICPPEPIYVREPDARPQAGFAIPRA
jgi:tRNA threonylcarbamoyladenosine biosynthesis protein TsaB